MFLSTSTASATFQVAFNTLTVIVYVGTDTSVPSTDVPSVTASYTDSGVTVIASPGQVTLSGTYTSIIPITWYWKNLTDTLTTGSSVPPAGTYLKIVQVDSPPFLTTSCIYTITGTSGISTFTHVVSLNSYGDIKTALNSALAGQP